MTDYKQRFGLDWLSAGKALAAAPQTQSAPLESSLPPGLDDLMIGYGGKLLAAFSNSKDDSARLFDLASLAGMRVDKVFPLIRYMEQKGLVQLVERDSHGNDTYKLTDTGKSLAALILDPLHLTLPNQSLICNT